MGRIGEREKEREKCIKVHLANYCFPMFMTLFRREPELFGCKFFFFNLSATTSSYTARDRLPHSAPVSLHSNLVYRWFESLEAVGTSRIQHFFKQSAHRWRWDYRRQYFTTPTPIPVLIPFGVLVDPRPRVLLQGLGKLKKKLNDHTENRTNALPACSIVPQPTTLPGAFNNNIRI
jgi:hypothetical protein